MSFSLFIFFCVSRITKNKPKHSDSSHGTTVKDFSHNLRIDKAFCLVLVCVCVGARARAGVCARVFLQAFCVKLTPVSVSVNRLLLQKGE